MEVKHESLKIYSAFRFDFLLHNSKTPNSNSVDNRPENQQTLFGVETHYP